MADTNVEQRNDTDNQTEKVDIGRRKRMRSLAIAGGLALLVALFYAATLIRLGGAVSERSL